jgi:hypothetical protein
MTLLLASARRYSDNPGPPVTWFTNSGVTLLTEEESCHSIRIAILKSNVTASKSEEDYTPDQLCALQAYAYCTHQSVMNYTWCLRTSEDRNIPLANEIMRFNDQGSNKDREFLLSILPELPHFRELLREKLTTELADTPELVEV